MTIKNTQNKQEQVSSSSLLSKFQSGHIEYHQIVAPKPFVRKSISSESTSNLSTATSLFMPKSQSHQVS
jgi:hypothetical protein